MNPAKVKRHLNRIVKAMGESYERHTHIMDAGNQLHPDHLAEMLALKVDILHEIDAATAALREEAKA